MCSQFSAEISSTEITKDIPELIFKKDFVICLRLLPHQLAPVIVSNQGLLKLTQMKFSLIPQWSQEPKVKFATHNARIESVHEKPTWKTPFLSQHCVVALSGFYESVYEGPNRGHIIQFKEKSDRLLYVACLFDFWNADPDAAKHFFSFAILTEDPSEFILQNGHDRSPIFLKPEHVSDWCSLKLSSHEETKKVLLSYKAQPDLKVEVDRALKAGWEKRI